MERLERRRGRGSARRGVRRLAGGCRIADDMRSSSQRSPPSFRPVADADRLGARTVALAAIAATLAGNGFLLLDESLELALVGRALAGVSIGAAFVAGLDLVRAGGGGPLLQGLYGGATMVGGGLALMVLPPLTDATDWRAPYWTAAVLALAAIIPLSVAGGLPRLGRERWSRPARPGAVPAWRPSGGDVRPRHRRGQLGGATPRTPGRELGSGRARPQG